MNTTAPVIVAVADHAVLVTFEGDITDTTLARIQALDAALTAHAPGGMTEIVPALTNLLVVFDPVVTDHAAISAAIVDQLATPTAWSPGARHHVVEACYDHEHAPDLSAAAARAGLDETTVIETHLSGTYRVGMYGFAPGYAYLYGTPAAIQLPRNPTPGPIVSTGSVIIAGQQCLIIPIAMSTGWFAIGRTAARALTGDSERPFLFDVGDTVTFRRIDATDLLRQLDRQTAVS